MDRGALADTHGIHCVFFFVRLQEKREVWEGQKGRRLSSSVATDKQAVAAYQWGSSGG